MEELVKEFLQHVDDNHLQKLYEDLIAYGDSPEILDQIDSRMEFLVNRANDKSFIPEISTYHKSRKHLYPGATQDSHEPNNDIIEQIFSTNVEPNIIKSTNMLRNALFPKKKPEPQKRFGYVGSVDEEGLDTEPADEVYFDRLAADFIDEEDVFDIKSVDPLQNRGRVNKPISLDTIVWLKGLDGKKSVGVDVAYYGSDFTVLAFRDGMHIVDMWSFGKSDTVETMNYIGLAIREFRPETVVLDATGGLGAAVYDMCRHTGLTDICNIQPVIMNEKPYSDRLRPFNKRAEMYLLLQERFREGTITIPSDKELIKELAYVKYKITGDGGTIRIAPKEEIKRELGRSPDRADAVAMAFYARPSFQCFV